jgi:hypothetical protein
MQFTMLGTVSFANIGKNAMTDANGLSTTVGQLASAAGITLVAMAVRFAQAITAVRDSWPDSH